MEEFYETALGSILISVVVLVALMAYVYVRGNDDDRH